jgi:hypothetical protein
MRLAWIGGLVLALASPVAHARGIAFLIPPAEVDVGVGAPLGDAAVGPSAEVLAGLHWASLYWKPSKLDIGVGYVGSFRAVRPDYAARMTSGSEDHELRMNGGYLDLAYALDTRAHWRTWLAARGELFSAELDHHSFSAMGAALRVATEVFVQGAAAGGGHGGGAAVAGTFAIGLYVEASARDVPDQLGREQLTAGLTLRVPFLFAAAN